MGWAESRWLPCWAKPDFWLPNPTRSHRPIWNGGLHHRAKAKRVVQLFMSGAASQCDTFDYKPELIKRNGQPFDPGEKVELFQSSPGACLASPWGWKQYGQSGKWMSDLVPHLATCVDDIAFIHSMVSKSQRARAGHVHAEHRLRAARFSQHGRLARRTAWGA